MENNWSIETIQERASNSWSLECDNQLLNLMKSISKNLEQRCTTTNDNLNRLMLDLDNTKVKLGNVTTKILDLHNVKFVEHTVMDMESNDDRCSVPENDKSFIPLQKAIQDAVTNGINMMDQCYEKVLLDLEDSDDDENENVQKHVVCRPKNPYIDRPLPYSIGSKQWIDKWHIGLIESDEEMLSEEELEEFSQSSEDGDSISISPPTSNLPTASESDFADPTVIPKNDLLHQLPDETKDNSPLFTNDFLQNREKIKVLSPISPIVNESKMEPPNKSKPVTESVKSKPLAEPIMSSSERPGQSIFIQQKPEKKFLNLFDDEPPLLEETIRVERKAVNLFLDSDDEIDHTFKENQKSSSIFNNNVPNRYTVPTQVPRMNNASVEDSSPTAFFDDFDNNNTHTPVKSATKFTPKSNDFGGLFDDEPPDDFFDIIVKDKGGKDKSNNSQQPKLQTKTVNLFESDEDDDDDFSKIIGTSTKDDSAARHITPLTRDFEEQKSSLFQDTSSQFNSPFTTKQNKGPPKSYVSFLDNEPLNLNLDEENQKTFSSNPLDTSKSVDSLFDDPLIPPFEPTRRSSSKIIYDDIPQTVMECAAAPTMLDDPFVPPAEPTKGSLSKIIYDDISQTVMECAAEPKTLDESLLAVTMSSQTKSPSINTIDEIDQSAAFKKNLSIFSNPSIGKPPPIDAENKPKPNKLKTKFNINVAALLPGAKLPSRKQSLSQQHDNVEEVIPKEDENIKEKLNSSGNESRAITTDADTSGRLSCLNKSRAKIQIQRKPSTRMGRQLLYDKSLIVENESRDDSNVTLEPDDAVDTSENRISQQNVKETPTENTSDNDWFTDAANDQSLPVPSNDDIDDDDDDWLKNIDEPSLPSNMKVDTEDNCLSTKVTAKLDSSQNVSHTLTMNYDWLTASSVPPDDINPPSNYTLDDYHDQDDWITSSDATKERPVTVTELPSHEDGWLTATETERSSEYDPTGDNENIENDWLTTTTSAIKANAIFTDARNFTVDEYKDDWLITSSDATKERPVTVTELPKHEDACLTATEPGRSSKDDPSGDNENIENDWLTTTTSALKKNAIFTDARDFSVGEYKDDWLTNTIKPQKLLTSEISRPLASIVVNESPPKLDFVTTAVVLEPKIATKKSLNLSLFDDDDDDDDLFSSKSQKKSVPKPRDSNKAEAVKSTKNISIKSTEKSLFGDDDSDDDDLFSSSRLKSKPTKNQTKIMEKEHGVKSKMNSPDTRVGAGLFDDEDGDDDDIFASKTPKPRISRTATVKQPSTTKFIPVSNDPLADLMK